MINKELLKILVIGSSVLDTIEYDDTIEHKPGGIFYTMLGLSCIKEEIDKIDLISNIDEQSLPLFESAFSSANLEYCTPVSELSSVHLRIYEYNERVEIFNNISQPLNIPKEINLKEYDGILINLISGYDIDLNQLKKIRADYDGLIYCDFHSLARDLYENNVRVHRLIPHVEEWLSNSNIIQVNEYELYTLFDFKSEQEIATCVLDAGVSAFIVTKGKDGVDLYFVINNNREHIHIDGTEVEATNRVGCGDIFGAVFFYNYIKSHDYHTSIKRANFSAGKSTEYSTFEQYKKLKYFSDDKD